MKIRVLSYNIHKGFSFSGWDFTLHTIKQALQETKADIVLLQEVVGENHQLRKAVPQWPTEAQFEFLADTVWPHYSYGKNAVFSLSHHGNAILSRFPIIKEENINISTNRWEKRGLLHCELMIPDLQSSIHIFNVHLDLMERGRQQQFNAILKRIQSHVPEHQPFLLGGDFNDWSKSLHGQFLEQIHLQESHTEIHHHPAKSFPSFFPSLSLDRVYFRNMRVIDCQTLTDLSWAKLSDHLPLLVEFDISSSETPAKR